MQKEQLFHKQRNWLEKVEGLSGTLGLAARNDVHLFLRSTGCAGGSAYLGAAERDQEAFFNISAKNSIKFII